MAKKSKKALGAAMAGVMAVGAVAGAANTMATQVQADVASDVKAANAKLEHLRNSLHNNYLGIKNQPTWESYAKEAQTLINKLPNGSTKDKYQERLDRANAMILAAASVNHAEFSIQKNFPKADNAQQWKAYAEKSMEFIKTVETGKEYSDRTPILVERVVKVNEFADVVLKLEDAREAKDVKAMEALKPEAKDLMEYFRVDMNYKDLMAYDLVNVIDQRIEEASGVVEDTEAPVLSYDGETEITVENGAEFTLPVVTGTDNKDEAVEVTSVITDADGNKIDAIDTTVAGVYTVTYSAEDAAGNKAEDVVVTVTVKEGKLAVESVSAITNKKVNVAFNSEVKDIKLADVTVVEKESGKKLYIKSATLSENKKEAVVEFYDALESGKTYNFEIKVGEEVLKSELNFVIGEASTIEVKDQVVNTTDGENKLSYKVLDENGFDITDITTVKVESNSSKFTASKGEVKVGLGNDEYAFVELKVTKKDGTVVSSDRIKVTAQDPKASAFDANWTLTATKSEPDYKAEDYKQDKTVNLSGTKFLDIELVDQFGKKFANETSVRYESLDTSVAVIDEVSGKITPRKEGKAVVKAKIMDGTTVVDSKVVELDVVAKAELAGINVNKDVVNAVTTSGLTETVKVTLVDQFGNSIAGDLDVDVADSTIATVTPDSVKDDADGKIDLTVTGLKKGSTSVKLTSGKFTKTITVNVSEAGNVVDYKVEGFKNELLVKDIATTDADETSMALTVKAVDADGLTKDIIKDYTVTVKDKDGKVVEGKAVNSDGTTTIKSVYTDVEGPYTVEIKVNTLSVFTGTYKVTDNRVAPEYTIKNNKLNLDDVLTFNDDMLSSIFDFGTDSAVKILDVDFVSNNEAVIKDTDSVKEGTVSSTKDGSASIYVDTITIDVDGKSETTDDIFVLSFDNFKVDVNTTSVQASEVKAAKSNANEKIKVLTETYKEKVATGNKKDANTAVEAAETAVKAYTDLGGATEDLTNYADIATVKQEVANQNAVDAEVTNYENEAIIANDVETDADVTATVKKLKSEQTATNGIEAKVTAVNDEAGTGDAEYLKVVDGTVTLVKDNGTGSAVKEKVTITFEKGGKTATLVVNVSVEANA